MKIEGRSTQVAPHALVDSLAMSHRMWHFCFPKVSI